MSKRSIGRLLYVTSIAALGATIGVIHAITSSPASEIVIEVIGAGFAAALALVAIEREVHKQAKVEANVLPLIAVVMFALLSGYWGSWLSVKLYQSNQMTLESSLHGLSIEDRAAAIQIILQQQRIGIDRATVVQELAAISSAVCDEDLSGLKRYHIVNLAAGALAQTQNNDDVPAIISTGLNRVFDSRTIGQSQLATLERLDIQLAGYIRQSGVSSALELAEDSENPISAIDRSALLIYDEMPINCPPTISEILSGVSDFQPAGFGNISNFNNESRELR